MTKRKRPEAPTLGARLNISELKRRKLYHGSAAAKLIKIVPEQQRPMALRESARRLAVVVEEAVSAGAVRLPYHGLLEAIVDLKRALQR